MAFRVVRTNQYNQDLGLIHSTNGNHLESQNEGSSIDHQVTIHLHAQNITMFPTNEKWYFASQMLVSCSGGLILILTLHARCTVPTPVRSAYGSTHPPTGGCATGAAAHRVLHAAVVRSTLAALPPPFFNAAHVCPRQPERPWIDAYYSRMMSSSAQNVTKHIRACLTAYSVAIQLRPSISAQNNAIQLRASRSAHNYADQLRASYFSSGQEDQLRASLSA
ncbi:integrator complex subunit 9 [Dorcoceras hygrometricum]|uniref:Integrator complex subunit 9 n=1 Tax=Dorcoceras hygrometricum TaxID=472368 RepID=A0A2Z7CEI1_9LAMI|nr:integrator complex subunit 9 [Dorcoceras hygrometricum]